MTSFPGARRALAVLFALGITLVVVAPAMAHEERDVHGYAFVVGFMNEPVYVGDKSGLEFFVNQNDQPIEGLEKTLQAEVIYGTAKQSLPLNARWGEKGAYESVFYPTAAGKYTFHISGKLPDGSTMDESFTSSPTGFNEVSEAVTGQFPNRFPAQAELVAQAQKGSDAASQATIALAVGVVALVLGIAGVGLGLAARSRGKAS